MRIGASFLILLSILFLPFICTVIFAFLAILYFRSYYEVIGLFLISDFLYGAGETRYWNIYFLGALSATIVLFAFELLKTKLKFYQKIA